MMRNILPTVLDTKCNNIYREERSIAQAVAVDVIGPQTTGVWDFMMPHLFFINLFKHKRKKEAYILNLLFTKKLALETARDMIDRDLTRSAALEQAAEATNRILAADKKGVYSDRVRQKQHREIEILVDHYYSLIMSEGKTFEAMLHDVYKNRVDYLEFIKKLNRAEKEVNHVALQSVGGNNAAREFVGRMEKAVEAIRQLDADKYFPVESEK